MTLKVLTDLSITRDIKLTKIEQSTGDSKKYHSFLNSGDGGYIFKITVVIEQGDRWGSKSVYEWINTWYANLDIIFSDLVPLMA